MPSEAHEPQTSPSSPPKRLTFPAKLRLHGPAVFRAHYNLGHRETAGPLVALALASNLPYTRIGFSVPKKVGSSPTRNRARRLLREAFRLSRPTHPAGVDLVLLIRPHALKSLADYQALLGRLITQIAARKAAGTLPKHPESR